MNHLKEHLLTNLLHLVLKDFGVRRLLLEVSYISVQEEHMEILLIYLFQLVLVYVRQDVIAQKVLLRNAKNHALQDISALKGRVELPRHQYYVLRVIIAQNHLLSQLYAPKAYIAHLEQQVHHND
jgi:hypothetical protein